MKYSHLKLIKFLAKILSLEEGLSFIFNFMFQLKLTFNVIFYQSQMYNMTMIFFTKCSPDISSTHLAPHLVITILLTILPVLHFPSCDCFVTISLYFLVSSPFSPSPPTPFFPWQPSVCFLSMSLFLFLFFHLFCSLDSTCK